ncbi:PAS domain-containing protein [Kordiimonas sp. SCSIO 12603]|uniref:PAS domain-containing protein n=1 Tax=Kordiimonas sp. SCSIO 12603 TaxID=2829596 RepID=UPI002107026C|nr:PAS domain-containing protein [Kordiimonas sp. SCSIO 12603]UTW59346.1 PAS domain-containing protein [Kordiimonas sp. SCSIO 12603]
MLNISNQQVASNTRFGAQTLYRGEEILGKNRAADFFYNHWHALRNQGLRPSREDIKPRNMTRFLDRVVLMDVVPQEPDGFQLLVKLIGGHVASYYGEIGGKFIESMSNKNAVKRIYRTSGLVIEEKQPILGVTPGFCEDRLFMEAHAIYSPLFDENMDVIKILVCVDVKSMNV